MLDEISKYIRNTLTVFPEQDSIIFNNTLYNVNKELFQSIRSLGDTKTVAFIDGGQAEILAAANFCLSFIRVGALLFRGKTKVGYTQQEFYLFTKAIWKNNDLVYESTIFPLDTKLIDEQDLLISSTDATIKNGSERAPITKVAQMARRFAELALAKKIEADHVLLDGALEGTFPNEEKYLDFDQKVSALAKSSSLFTVLGNSPVVLLNKIGPEGTWCYPLNKQTHFVKLHPRAKHVFRFEGNTEIFSHLILLSGDALFLGYPYGLLMVDKLARVSNQEKKTLMMKFLLNKENKEIAEYLHTSNAHDILDSLG